MMPQLFPILKDNDAITALLGSNPLRIFPFDEAPEGVELPYMTYNVYSANPENTMDKPPLLDMLSTQIDIWAATHDSCLSVAASVRDALEPHAHMTSIGHLRDQETKAYRIRLDFDFFTER